MWRTSAVLLVTCLAVALAIPAEKEARIKNLFAEKASVQQQKQDLVADVPLISKHNEEHKQEEQKNSMLSRIIRSFGSGNVKHAIAFATHNVFAVNNKTPITIQTTGHRTTLTFGTKTPTTSAIDMNMVLSLDYDITYVYGKQDCKKTNCIKNEGPDFYDTTAKTPEKKKDGTPIDFTFVYNTDALSGKIYTDKVVSTGYGLGDKFYFAVVRSGNDSTQTGPDDDAEGMLGLGFDHVGTYSVRAIDTLFKLADKGYEYILFWRDGKAADPHKATGGILIGTSSYDTKCSNITTDPIDIYYNKSTKLQQWWFSADVDDGSGNVNKSLTVKLDPTFDSIGLPKYYTDLIEKNANKGSVDDIKKLPVISLSINSKDNLRLHPAMYTSGGDDGKSKAQLLTVREEGKKGYDIVLGTPFFKEFCYVFQHTDDTYKLLFKIPQEHNSSARSFSFLALAAIPLAYVFRF